MYFATTHLMLQSIMWRNITEYHVMKYYRVSCDETLHSIMWRNITEYQVTKHDRVSWDEILQSIMWRNITELFYQEEYRWA
jgi:hypothetical protein